MRKKALGITVILLSTLFILVACGNDSDLIGRWRIWAEHENSAMGGQVYIFRRGGEGVWHDGRIISHAPLVLHEIPITWNVSGDRLEIFFDGQATATIYYFRFVDDDMLMLRGIDWPEGTGMVLTRLE